MARLNQPTARMVTVGSSPVKPKASKNTFTYEGGLATALKAKSELFTTAVSTFAGEHTFYESAADRLARIVKLTHKLTDSDPEWVRNFAAWLRGPEANLRTVSLVIAAEYVSAGGERGREIINSVCQRADEPAEILAYWINNYGHRPSGAPSIPQAIRKGLSDAVLRLYSEYSVLKYFGTGNQVNMASVLNLIHPKPQNDKQKALFAYIIDRAYGNDLKTAQLPLVALNRDTMSMSGSEFTHWLSAENASSAGLTWEQVGSKLPDGWTPEAWETIEPNMGYMALLRNLSNFEKAGVSKAFVQRVNDRLTNPVEVARSKQLPFRFFSAFSNVNSSKFSAAIEEALDLSLVNITSFTGSTLILVDTSFSMTYTHYSKRGSVSPIESATLFGAALALSGSHDADVVAFATESKPVYIPEGSSVLKAMSRIATVNVGTGTNMHRAISNHYDGHDRVIVLTDMQYHAAFMGEMQDDIPFIHYYDLNGYGSGSDDLRKKGRFMYGGMSDTSFKMMPLIEAGHRASWPWEQ